MQKGVFGAVPSPFTHESYLGKRFAFREIRGVTFPVATSAGSYRGTFLVSLFSVSVILGYTPSYFVEHQGHTRDALSPFLTDADFPRVDGVLGAVRRGRKVGHEDIGATLESFFSSSGNECPQSSRRREEDVFSEDTGQGYSFEGEEKLLLYILGEMA